MLDSPTNPALFAADVLLTEISTYRACVVCVMCQLVIAFFSKKLRFTSGSCAHWSPCIVWFWLGLFTTIWLSPIACLTYLERFGNRKPSQHGSRHRPGQWLSICKSLLYLLSKTDNMVRGDKSVAEPRDWPVKNCWAQGLISGNLLPITAKD